MIAALFDTHGNLPAVEAVIDDARSAGATRWILGGDLVALGGWPGETLALLQSLAPIACVRGNWERWMGQPESAPFRMRSAARTYADALGPDAVRWLTHLSTTELIEGWSLFHASPASDVESFPVEPSEALDRRLANGWTGKQLMVGHLHVPFERLLVSGQRLVNPGSVGLPFDGDTRASYALIDGDGDVRFRRVPYDLDRTRSQLVQRFGRNDWVEMALRMLHSARFSDV